MNAVARYLDFVSEEYLAGFIREGGAAVKFAVAADDATALEVHAQLRTRADGFGYVCATVDAATVKMHMIDHVFHAVARQIPWAGLANAFVVRMLNEMRFPSPPGEPLSLEVIARHNRYDFQELRNEFNRRLQEEISQDYTMAQEFRIAMMRLCQAEATANSAANATRGEVLQWLTGELRQIANLKAQGIYQKIARHNARNMLFSLARWIQKAGWPGLVLDLDIRQCAIPSRNLTDGIFYTKAAAIDVYEVLRQLIDATDELSSCFCVVTCGTEFLSDPARGLDKYTALRMRILDEVHDRNRANPFAVLIRLGAGDIPPQARGAGSPTVPSHPAPPITPISAAVRSA